MPVHSVNVPGSQTRVIEVGDGDTVLLIHGVTARADRWMLNLRPLAEAGYRAIAFDLPGHGFADKPLDFTYSAEGYAQFCMKLLDELAIEDAHLVGTSFGGMIAAKATATHPDRVRSLSLVGSVGLLPMGEFSREYMRDSISDMSIGTVANRLYRLVHDDSLVSQEWIQAEHGINLRAGGRAAFRKLADYFGTHLDCDLVLEDLKQQDARIPVGLFWGQFDPDVPLAVAHEIHASLDDSWLSVIEESAHAPYLEQPQSFSQKLVSFLNGARDR